jgi:glycosyltransferase involved in cell wall biosynthesis
LATVARSRLGNVEWVGVDIREDAVEFARSRYGWATFEVASAADLPYDDESFDVVVAAVLFSSLPSAELERRVSSEIARVLKPGGRLIWYDMRFPNPWNAAIHHMAAPRIRSLFRGWSTSLRSVTLLPPLARRLGTDTRRRYGRLHRFPFLRSHLVGTLIKPPEVPRLLLVTGLWPTADMPSAGSFVRDRVSGTTGITVVGPHRYDTALAARYIQLAWEAFTARGRFDGVEAHVLFPTGLIGLIAARLRGVPLVVYAHGDEVRNAIYRNRLFRWLGKRVAGGAAALVANSSDTARHVAVLGGPAPYIVPPGIELSRFHPSPRPALRRVLYIGGNRPEKGYDTAVKFADTLIGPYLDERDPTEIPRMMAEHDVLLVPSREEGFGLAAAEAIASGRWPVANAVGGLVDVIHDGVNGTLVRDEDYAAAIAAVPDYDPEAVAVTAERFDIPRHRAGLAAIWRSVLKGVSAEGVERLQPPKVPARGSVAQPGQSVAGPFGERTRRRRLR